MTQVTDHLGVSTSHYAAIGKVAVTWSLFEAVIDISIWHLTDLERYKCACLTSQIQGSGRKLDAVLSLVRLLPNEDARIKLLNAFAKNTQSLAERRNRIIHDPWIGDGDQIIRLEATARKALKLEQIRVPSAEIDVLLNDMTAHYAKYVELMRDFLPPELSSPRTPA